MRWMTLVLCLVLCSCAPTAPEVSDATVAELEARIPQLLDEARIPGLQIAMVRDSKVVWEAGFGTTSTSEGVAVTPSTTFEAASLTKPLFAYAVMQLVDEGLVDLDLPVHSYLPTAKLEEFLRHPVDAPGFRKDWFETITARHILSHSAGTPHGEGGEVWPLLFEPGSDWKYSAAGYQLLQLAVEELSGESLDVIIDRTVLQPLGMSDSSMVWRDELEATMARGHGLYSEASEIRKRSEPTAAASLYTTAGDYARFVCAVIDGERLQPGTHQTMLRSFADMSDDGAVGWGLGFGTQTDEIGKAFWQWGDYGIFRNYIIADPETGDGVIYLTNSFNGLAICSEVVEISLGRPPMGCLELGYQQHDGAFYALLWAAREEGAEEVAAMLPDAVEGDPELFDQDRLAGMGGLFEDEQMLEEAMVFHRLNLERNPDVGRMAYNMARMHMLNGEFDEAEKLLQASMATAEEPMEAAAVEWINGYLTAMKGAEQLSEAAMQAIAGDYGPRHIRLRDGRLYYSRDSTDVAAQRPLLAQSEDTFVIEGVTYFKLQVVFDEHGAPFRLVGHYEGGGTDESLRDP